MIIIVDYQIIIIHGFKPPWLIIAVYSERSSREIHKIPIIAEDLWFYYQQHRYWLVVYLPLWKIWVRQWEGWQPIYEMENNPAMFETTNQISH